MFQVFSATLLLVYFWYFFSFSFRTVPKPTTAAPTNPPTYNAKFIKLHNRINKFQFMLNNVILWEHDFSDEKSYMVRSSGDIIQKDDCFYVPPGKKIPATGQLLYEYLKKNPELKDELSFRENSPYTVQKGGVFYFKCRNKKIHELHICPSGTVFQKSTCMPVSSCTGKQDGTLIPDPTNSSHYFECKNGREFPGYCGSSQFFYHDRCIPRNELAHFCKFHTYVKPFVLEDEITQVQCLNSKPVYTRCSTGWKFFEHDYCEPTICVGKPDGTKLALPDRTLGEFNFSPGYTTCYADKVGETVTCPQIWDPLSTKGDNLTHLPMVFDGRVCTVPSFCENVFSPDPYTIVPVHEFTKDVRNWGKSELYDSVAGYMCEGKGRKRLAKVSPFARINKRFKQEPACRPGYLTKLPIYEKPDSYYDCDQNKEVTCPSSHFFNGTACIRIPENAFAYRNISLFQFDPLNIESWIHSWNYAKPDKMTCRAPESVHISLYDICSHPDCVPYDFLTMIPDLAILLPPTTSEKSRCKFDENAKLLQKEAVDFKYRFWEQRAIQDELDATEYCTPGQKLKTGNFIFDSTVYATCDETQPFLFCPSVHTNKIISAGSEYACGAPDSNIILFDDTNPPTHFAEGEVKRILPIDWNGTDRFKLTANARDFENLPQEGYTVDQTAKVILEVTRPVHLELRYRVTHPPHIAFKYNNYNEQMILHGQKGKGFLVKRGDFTEKELTFPRYHSNTFVTTFKKIHF